MERISLFAYGTLKFGCVNFNGYCSGAADINDAWIIGNIHNFSSQSDLYPIIKVPYTSILYEQTTNLGIDLSLYIKNYNVYPRKMDVGDEYYGVILGQIITFEDTPANLQERFSELDRLEGLTGSAKVSTLGYSRKIVNAQTLGGNKKITPCFVYHYERVALAPKIEGGLWVPGNLTRTANVV